MLEQIVRELDSTFGIATGAEVSIEADPGTFDAARLRSYMSLGINRVSVGVQVIPDCRPAPGQLLWMCTEGKLDRV